MRKVKGANKMNTIVYFGMPSVALGLIAWFTIFATIIWPKMKSQPKFSNSITGGY